MVKAFSLKHAPLSDLIYLRSYSRLIPNSTHKEIWSDTVDRTIKGLDKICHYTQDELSLVTNYLSNKVAFPSGRWLWCGGTKWVTKPANFYGAYNCSNIDLNSWESIGTAMNLLMCGCGVGAILFPEVIQSIPVIRNKINVIGIIPPGVMKSESLEDTRLSFHGKLVNIDVGDSRKGWVDAYVEFLKLSSSPYLPKEMDVFINCGFLRPKGTLLKGFGGVANPDVFPKLFYKAATILNKYTCSKLDPMSVSLLLDEASLVIVAGNIRRSSGIRQFSHNDIDSHNLKKNLWSVNQDGKWVIDETKDALRMANHTITYTEKPTLEQCAQSVKDQFYSGEGTIQWAGAIEERGIDSDLIGLNPCGEIVGRNFLCNLADVHLNMLDPNNDLEQVDAFKSASLMALPLLNHRFEDELFRKSRDRDPIIGISFTGAFTFFVEKFGIEWAKWWASGRTRKNPNSDFWLSEEVRVLSLWKNSVKSTVEEYCTRHGLKIPSRTTTVQPSGSKTLLTGAGACGWHAPKSKCYIRRMTFAAHDPIAMAAIDFGYSIVPSSTDRNSDGSLIDDPFDSRVTEWLVEVPVMEPWSDLDINNEIDPSSFPIEAQFDFYMQVQKHYTEHNTSGTFEIFENEIDTLANLIFNAIDSKSGYISCAVLSRSTGNSVYPRLPFEPISRETYDELQSQILSRQVNTDIVASYNVHNSSKHDNSPMDHACSGGSCSIKRD